MSVRSRLPANTGRWEAKLGAYIIIRVAFSTLNHMFIIADLCLLKCKRFFFCFGFFASTTWSPVMAPGEGFNDVVVKPSLSCFCPSEWEVAAVWHCAEWTGGKDTKVGGRQTQYWHHLRYQPELQPIDITNNNSNKCVVYLKYVSWTLLLCGVQSLGRVNLIGLNNSAAMDKLKHEE